MLKTLWKGCQLSKLSKVYIKKIKIPKLKLNTRQTNRYFNSLGVLHKSIPL